MAVCVLAFVRHALVYWTWLEDDTFISLRYADNLVRGLGLVFNPGERVEGFSNPLWVAAAAGLIRLGLDPLVWLRVLGVAAGALCLPVAWRLALAIAPGAGSWALLAPVLLAASPVLARHSVSGLETSLFALLLAGGLLLALAPAGRRRPRSLAAVLLLLAAARPEGPAVALLLALVPHARARWGRADAGPVADRPSPWPLLVLVAGCGLGLAWRWSYYGSLVPNTYLAKMTGTRGAIVDGIQYTLRFLRNGAAGGFLLGLGVVPLIGSRRLDRAQTTALLALAYAAFIVVAGGDWMKLFRLYAHLLPVAAALLGAGAGLLVRAVPPRGSLRLQARLALAAVSLVSLLMIGDHEQQVAADVLPDLRAGTYLAQRYAELGRWLAVNSPPGASVALSDIGAVAYYSHRRIVDMFGLVDRHIAAIPGKPHHKFDPRYVLSRHPDYVVLIESRYESGRFWRLPDTALHHQPDFQQGYELIRSLPMGDEIVELYRARGPATPPITGPPPGPASPESAS